MVSDSYEQLFATHDYEASNAHPHASLSNDSYLGIGPSPPASDAVHTAEAFPFRVHSNPSWQDRRTVLERLQRQAAVDPTVVNLDSPLWTGNVNNEYDREEFPHSDGGGLQMTMYHAQDGFIAEIDGPPGHAHPQQYYGGGVVNSAASVHLFENAAAGPSSRGEGEWRLDESHAAAYQPQVQRQHHPYNAGTSQKLVSTSFAPLPASRSGYHGALVTHNAEAQYTLATQAWNTQPMTHGLFGSYSAAQQRAQIDEKMRTTRLLNFHPRLEFGLPEHPGPSAAHKSDPIVAATSATASNSLQWHNPASHSAVHFGYTSGSSGTLINISNEPIPVHGNHAVAPIVPRDGEILPSVRFEAKYVKEGVFCSPVFRCSWEACTKAFHYADYTNDADCSKDLKYQEDVRAHLDEHVDELKPDPSDQQFVCRWGSCTVRRKEPRNLGRHVRTTGEDGHVPFYSYCPQCPDKRFSRNNLVNKHRDAVHGNAAASQRTDENEQTVSVNSGPSARSATKRRQRAETLRPAKRRKTTK